MVKGNEIGSTGLEVYDGYVQEEFLTQLQGIKSVKVYKEMENNDATIGAILFAIQNLIRQVDWVVEPFSDDEKDLESAEFLESCMDDMSHTWEDTIDEILSMLVFGWSYHEIVYKSRKGFSKDGSRRSKYEDGKIGWRKMPIRAQETLFKWEMDESGGIQGMWQQAPPKFQPTFIPIEKALLFRTETRKNNPEGKSILRNSYKSWYFKKHIEEIEGIGIERDLAGLPVLSVPPELLSSDATPEQKTLLSTLKKIVTNVRRDEQEGVILPMVFDEQNNSLYKFELMSTGGRRQFDTNEIVTRYDQRIAMSVLADFILLGTNNVGSYSLSENKSRLFTIAISTWMDTIASVFNTHAVSRLFELNGMDMSRLPKIKHAEIEEVNLEELGKYITSLSSVGAIIPDQELEVYLRKLADLPLNPDHAHSQGNR